MYQEAGGAVQQAANPGDEAAREEGRQLHRDPVWLLGTEQTAHHKVLTYTATNDTQTFGGARHSSDDVVLLSFSCVMSSLSLPVEESDLPPPLSLSPRVNNVFIRPCDQSLVHPVLTGGGGWGVVVGLAPLR